MTGSEETLRTALSHHQAGRVGMRRYHSGVMRLAGCGLGRISNSSGGQEKRIFMK